MSIKETLLKIILNFDDKDLIIKEEEKSNMKIQVMLVRNLKKTWHSK